MSYTLYSFALGMAQAKKPTGPIPAIVICLIAYTVTGLAPAFVGVNAENTGNFYGQFAMTGSFMLWILTIFSWAKFKEKRPVSSIGLKVKGAGSQILLGALGGLAFTGIIVGVNVFLGTATMVQIDNVSLLPALVLLLGFSIQASAEEIAYRGYVAQALIHKWSIGIAVVVQAALFTLGHLGNGLNIPAVIAMLAVSYFMMMWTLATGNLWGAMAFHTFWNWSQANLWGASVSNITMSTHIFSFMPKEGTDLISGGGFGLEGSLLTGALLIAGGIYCHRKWLRACTA